MRKSAFGWDCNQTGICDEPPRETGEGLLVGERTLGYDPEASNTAHGGGAEKP